VKWPDFDGYGFNLHGEKTKPGQYIGKVDPDSPAELAGLKPNDRIIEVNGTNISNENHKQVVQRIKAIPNETKLLVLDEKEDQYYKNLNVVVTGTMPNVLVLKTPVPRPSTLNNAVITTTNGSNGTTNDNESGTGTHSDEDHDRASHVSDSGSGSSIPSKNNSLTKMESRNGFSITDEDVSSSGPSPTPPGSSASPSPTPIMSLSNGKSNKTLDLNMTAQEMRAILAARKKEKLDAKNAKIDLRKKYDIIQTL
jgi:membrane-associated protease RseP (regulator of RpoE activity)